MTVSNDMVMVVFCCSLSPRTNEHVLLHARVTHEHVLIHALETTATRTTRKARTKVYGVCLSNANLCIATVHNSWMNCSLDPHIRNFIICSETSHPTSPIGYLFYGAPSGYHNACPTFHPPEYAEPAPASPSRRVWQPPVEDVRPASLAVENGFDYDSDVSTMTSDVSTIRMSRRPQDEADVPTNIHQTR